MTATASLLVRPLEPSDEPGVLELLGTALAGGPTGSRTAEFFRWKHHDNPFGRSPGLVAVVDDRIVGLRLFLRWEFRAGERVVRAVRPVDTATHPDHRGRGIFRTLTLALVDSLAGEVDLIVNTPNDQSRPGYLRMGWQPVGVVPIQIRPVHWGRFLRGFRGAGHGQPPGPTVRPPGTIAVADVLADPRLSELLAAMEREQDRRLHTARTPGFLRWRYADPPGLTYAAVVVESGAELCGVAIGRVRQRGGLREFTLADVLCRPGDRSAATRTLRSVARLDVDHIAMHAPPGTPAAAVRRQLGYLQVPRGGMHLVARPVAGPTTEPMTPDPTTPDPMTPDPMTLDSWRLALGDLEVF